MPVSMSFGRDWSGRTSTTIVGEAEDLWGREWVRPSFFGHELRMTVTAGLHSR